MTEWKQGDTVQFTETGTITHINNDIATIDVRGIPHTMHVSHIIGTPEQAKRDRIIATLSQEFSGFIFEPAKDNGQGIINCAGSVTPYVNVEARPNLITQAGLQSTLTGAHYPERQYSGF